MGRKCWIPLGAIVVAGLVGCQTGRTDDGEPLPEPSGAGLVANPKSPLPDVPMPVTFRAVPSQSRTSVTPTSRVVDHVYQGLSTVADTVAYYRRVTTEHGWQPVREQMLGAHVLMRYAKGREILEIEVHRRNDIVNAQVRIRDNTAPPLPAKP